MTTTPGKLATDCGEPVREGGLEWRCFHCSETFNTVSDARDHFGDDLFSEPGCVLKLSGGDLGLLAIVRELEFELRRYRNEDQPIMREIYAMGGKHARELIEAEQKGYDKGLRDGQTLLAAKPLPPDVAVQVEAHLRDGMAERECARFMGISHGRVRGVSRKMKRKEPQS